MTTSNPKPLDIESSSESAHARASDISKEYTLTLSKSQIPTAKPNPPSSSGKPDPVATLSSFE
jgi:hypothetical protein